jgi:hypothetical protein
MPIKTYTDYVKQSEALYKQVRAITDPADAAYKTCAETCDDAYKFCKGECVRIYSGPDPNPVRDGCLEICYHAKAACLKECEDEKDKTYNSPQVTKLLDARDKLDDDAYKSGVITNQLIISDKELADLTDQIRAGTVPPTPVDWVTTADGLRRALAKDRRTGVLTLVTFGQGRDIHIGGKLISLADLCASARMSVADTVTLEGLSDGSTPMLAQQEQFRQALRAGGPVLVRWKKTEPSITVQTDKRTKHIPSVLPDGLEHFVTVKGAGEVQLKASVTPNTRAYRSAIKWTANGVTIADGPKASISRKASQNAGQKVVVQVSAFASTKTVWSGSCGPS